MTSPNFPLYDELMTNEDETVGLVIPNDDAPEFEEYEAARVDLDYLEDAIEMAREVGWEHLWVSTKDHTRPVFIEADDEETMGRGSLVIAPILPDEEDNE